eukprot:3918120-Heterocapsa_arctica.AAC.1
MQCALNHAMCCARHVIHCALVNPTSCNVLRPPRNPNCARDAIQNGFTAPANAFELTHHTFNRMMCIK